MDASKEQVEGAILFFAQKFNQAENYRALMDMHTGMPRIIEMIVYEMFLHRYTPVEGDPEEYYQYNLIYEYATELRKMGWVNTK